MAEPLKDQFGVEVIEAIADMIEQVATPADGFDRTAFVAECVDGFEQLELTPRARHIAAAMADHLPVDRERALELLTESLGPELADSDEFGMAPFRYLPYVNFVADHGHDDYEAAMRLQYEVTKRFTAEFSIRAYLVGPHRNATLARLREWAADPSEHVRRLVSEGSRPRLPWAARLGEFVDDPSPVVELLELLRHDRSEYVRRSVANNLNDIAKDHPELVVEICARWATDPGLDPAQADDERRMIRHALRTLIKQGHPGALAVLGFDADSPVRVVGATIDPPSVAIGGKVVVVVEIEHPASSGLDEAGALVDLRVHFVKANGTTSPKVFKGAELRLAADERAAVRKTVSLKQHSTRTHYAGAHRVEALVNGVAVDIGDFELTD